MSNKVARIGTGSAHTYDRIPPALALAEHSAVDYLVFDRIGEGSLAMWQQQKHANPDAGFDTQVSQIAEVFGPYVAQGLHIIGNFGGANIPRALEETRAGLVKGGAEGTRIGVVIGDDVLGQLVSQNAYLPELDCHVSDLGDSVISANAYIGADPILEVLADGAHFVIGGRLCDASLAVGAACHEMSWDLDNSDAVALSTLVGHLLTGGSGITGGGFADPPYRVVPGLDNLGFAFATVQSGEFTLSKLPDTGGMITTDIIKGRISYEITDPASYLTPDVSANFMMATVDQVGKDQVKVSGISGNARPEQYRVLVGVNRGWNAIAQISYGGPGCLTRAQLAEEVVRKRIEPLLSEIDDLRCDFVGRNSLYGDQYVAGEPTEVTLRIAATCKTQEVAALVAEYGTYLYWGPAGGGAMEGRVESAIGVTEAFIPRSSVDLKVEVVEA